jgi:NAD(P)-dependent dehydrogenase (short-subunit alcohol dehydrogenase family)
MFCARHAEGAEELAKQLTEKGPGIARFLQCDVAEFEQLAKLIDTTVAEYGQIDCLINNAGWHPGAQTR